MSGIFAYFNSKCHLIGATVQPLVATDCKHWQTQNVNKIADRSNYLHNAHSSAIARNDLYIGGDKGIYKTRDGINWSQEQLPHPEESNQHNFENRFYSMAVGNNKLIISSNWWQDRKRRRLIYIKDLATNRWSYEVYPMPAGNITRGKDRLISLEKGSNIKVSDMQEFPENGKIVYLKEYGNVIVFR